jgi:putative oxidoreductase
MLTSTQTLARGGERSLLDYAIATDGSASQALLRSALALVLLPHGAQHLLGAFGGYGFAGTLGWMTGTLGIPAPLAAAGILLEFFGPIALVLGIGSRFVAGALAIFMATAGSTHLANGFFMNWLGTMPAGAEGFEFHILAVAIALAVAARGAGAFSVDAALVRRRDHR